MDHKALADSAVASSLMNVHKHDKDEDSVNSLDDDAGTRSSRLSIPETKAIIKAGFQQVLHTLNYHFYLTNQPI